MGSLAKGQNSGYQRQTLEFEESLAKECVWRVKDEKIFRVMVLEVQIEIRLENYNFRGSCLLARFARKRSEIKTEIINNYLNECHFN